MEAIDGYAPLRWSLPEDDRVEPAIGAVLSVLAIIMALAFSALSPQIAQSLAEAVAMVIGWIGFAVCTLGMALPSIKLATWRIALHDGYLETKGILNNAALAYDEVTSVEADYLGFKLANDEGKSLRIFLVNHYAPLHFADLLTELARRCPPVEEALQPDTPWESPAAWSYARSRGMLWFTFGLMVSGSLATDGFPMSGLTWLIIAIFAAVFLVVDFSFKRLVPKRRISAYPDELVIQGGRKPQRFRFSAIEDISVEEPKTEPRIVLTSSEGERIPIPIVRWGGDFPPDYLVSVLAHLYLGKSIEDVAVEYPR